MKLLSPILILLLFLVASCGTPLYVSVPVEYTPHSYFRKDTTTIVVINRFDADALKIGNKKKLAVFKAGAFTAIKSAAIQLGKLPHVKTINLADSADFKVDTDSIKLIARNYKADYVLALTNFNAGIEMNEFDGSASFYSSNVAVNFLLYEHNGIYSKKLDGAANDPIADKLSNNLLAVIALEPAVGRNKATVNSSADHAAQNALREYLPYAITHNRPLYNDDFLMPAVKEIVAHNFEKADSLLQPFLQDKVKERASKAAYNLSVVYEAEGDIGAAINAAQQSSDLFFNEYATAILYDLKQE
jgi:hypothetical protein